MIHQIAKGFSHSPFTVVSEDEAELILARANYHVVIHQVGDYDLDVWIEGPYGDSDVILTSPSGLDTVINELYDENYAQLGLSNYGEDDWV